MNNKLVELNSFTFSSKNNGFDEWCPYCTEETTLPRIEDAKYQEDFSCTSCGALLEPESQKEFPYMPILHLFPKKRDKEYVF